MIWNSCQSTYFRLKNWVKRGGVLSPTLFNLYIDRLLVTLKNSGLGCHIDGTYMGALSYADDITLTCPSVHGLNKMMNMCSDFVTNNFITFNAKKTKCIKYGESVRLSEHVILDGNVISWHTGVRHLGNFFNYYYYYYIFIPAYKYIACKMCTVLNIVHIYVKTSTYKQIKMHLKA